MTLPDQPDPTPAPDDARVTLVTLGEVRLSGRDPESGETLPASLPAGKTLALLTYLHCLPGRTATREHLADLFWDDSTPEAARQALRQTLYRIRTELGAAAITSNGDSITLTLPIACDRDAFLDAIRDGRATQAVEAYGGEFFPAYAAPGAAGFEQWTDLEREQLQAGFLRAAESAVRQALDHANTREAIRLARKARDLRPASELAWRLLIESLAASGSRPAALLEADTLMGRLRADDREPEPATIRLVDRIRQPEAASRSESLAPPPGLLHPELVGREREFATLLESWQACARLGGRHVHVAGPAGLGKTRLVSELARRLRMTRGRIVQVSGVPGERRRSWGFLGDLVTALGQLPGVTGTAPGSLAELARLAPLLTSFLSERPAASHAPVDETARMLALADLLASVAQEAPLAILLDDLHWADDESWRVVDSLVKRLGPASVLVVTASRPGQRGSPSGPQTVAIELWPLTQSGVEALLISLGADPGHPAIPRLAGILGQSSGGSPLLVLESLRLAVERGDLEIDAGGWRWDNPDAVLAALSDSDPLAHRIEVLPQAARAVLDWLAFAEVPLPEEALAPATPGSAQAVAHLEQVGLITRSGQGLQPTHDEVAAAVRRLATPPEARAAHIGLATWCAQRMEADPGAFQRAARHLRTTQDRDGLEELFRDRVRLARRRREPVSLRELARLAMEPDATPDQVERLLGRLGRMTRWRHGSRPFALGAAAAAVALLPLLVALSRRPEEAPEAVLILATGGERAGEPIELRSVPVSVARWSSRTPVSPLEGRLLTRLPAGRQPYMTLAASPALDRFAFDEVTSDSGGIDVMLLDRDGKVRRLTSARGDDIHPAWSPDGALLAFASMRWTEDGTGNSDIVLLDPGSQEMRRLTRGPAYDAGPTWSPDGTRLAFSRRNLDQGYDRTCWIGRNGARESCLGVSAESTTVPLAWAGPDTLLVLFIEPAGRASLRAWAVDDPAPVLPVRSEYPPHRVDHAGIWAILDRRSDFGASLAVADNIRHVTSLVRPELSRPIPMPRSSGRIAWAPVASTGTALARVEVHPRTATATTGIAHQLHLRGWNAHGEALRIGAGAAKWQVSDSTVARVDPRTGRLQPLRPGAAKVTVSVAGWRSDTLTIPIAMPNAATVFTETWQVPAEENWELFGIPLPTRVTAWDGSWALLNNGDETFDSGALSRLRMAGPNGIGLEARVSLPVTQPMWQQLRIGLSRNPEIVVSGVTSQAGCDFRAPSRDGVSRMGKVATATSDDLAMPPEVLGSDDRWLTVLLQVFPDGSCGLALSGRPVWRGPAGQHGAGFWRVVTQGRTVGTRMLLGPLSVWNGVRTDINWAALERQAAAPAIGVADPTAPSPPSP